MFILILKFVLSIVLSFLLYIVFDTIYYLFKFRSLKKYSEKVRFKQSSWFDRLFVQFPKAFAYELITKDPNDFKDTGLILFEGQQGAGKTMAMTHYCNLLKAKYPDLIICSNYGLLLEDFNLDSWEPVVGDLNGRSGLCACFDEISLWFNNRNYANFPPDFLRTIVQNRKEHRLILGSCQQLVLVDKQIRRQCTEVRKCRTFFGCVTVVWKFRPVFNGDGDIERLVSKGLYWFVQEQELRYQYDTFRVVENLKKVGFNEKDRSCS